MSLSHWSKQAGRTLQPFFFVCHSVKPCRHSGVCMYLSHQRVHEQQIHSILAIDHIDSFLLLVQMILLVQTYGLFFIINFGPFQLPVAVTSELSWNASQDALK